MALARLESGTTRFDTTPISVKALIEELHIAFADALAAKNLTWKTTLSSEDVTLNANPELLRMILRNLSDNAIRFTDSKGNIELSVRRNADAIVFEVADTGCGIAPADQQRVFERFYQVEQSRSGSNRGTGLGLSIVRHAATAMNAKLNLPSTPGQGTCVTMEIPQTA